MKITTEPCGKVYQALISYAGKKCPSFSLVWPVNMKVDNSAHQIHHKLIEFMKSENKVQSEWVAEDCKDDLNPIIRNFVVNPKSLNILIEAPFSYSCPERENKVHWRINKNRKPGLYSWIAPALPEDLTFYSPDGLKWMMSISHEEEAYFDNSIVSYDEIIENVPGIKVNNSPAGSR